MNRGDGFPTTTGTGSTTNRIITGPGCRGDSTTGIRGRVNFYFGGGYVGWAPWGHYGGHGRNVTNVVINQTIINRWNPRDPGNGLNVGERERILGEARDSIAVSLPPEPSPAGFGKDCQASSRTRSGGRRSVQARGRVSRSANAFRSRSVSPIRSGTDPAAAPSRRGTASTRSSFSSTPTSRAATGKGFVSHQGLQRGRASARGILSSQSTWPQRHQCRTESGQGRSPGDRIQSRFQSQSW